MITRLRSWALAISGLFLGAGSLSAELMELEGAEGRTVTARIIRVSESKATLVRKGGTKQMTVSLSKFSEATQAKLRKWAQENKSYSFLVKAKASEILRSGDLVQYGYDVRVTNQSGEPLRDLLLEYRVYNSVGEMRSGKEEIHQMLTLRDVVVTTVAASKTLEGNLQEWNGKIHQGGGEGNHLGGVWIRIYTAERKKIFEWKDLKGENKGARWKK